MEEILNTYPFIYLFVYLMTYCALGTGKTAVNKELDGASLVAQWLRIRLPMQGTRVRALVREDTTCHGATKPERHNY